MARRRPKPDGPLSAPGGFASLPLQTPLPPPSVLPAAHQRLQTLQTPASQPAGPPWRGHQASGATPLASQSPPALRQPQAAAWPACRSNMLANTACSLRRSARLARASAASCSATSGLQGSSSRSAARSVAASCGGRREDKAGRGGRAGGHVCFVEGGIASSEEMNLTPPG